MLTSDSKRPKASQVPNDDALSADLPSPTRLPDSFLEPSPQPRRKLKRPGEFARGLWIRWIARFALLGVLIAVVFKDIPWTH